MNNDFKYKPTLAFWKIKDLIAKGLPQFKPEQQKVFVIQGGQGAGKTIAILMLLIDYLERNKAEITICSAELTKLKGTALNDFIKILTDWGLFKRSSFNKVESIYTYATGHFCEFLGLDKSDVGKGRRRKIVYINEANRINLNQFTDITARAEIVIIDYNPDSKFWGHDLITDFNFINLTYLDNEFLPDNEVRNILAYKEKGYASDGTTLINEFWANKWRVFGLGEIGSVEGRVFYGWQAMNFEDFRLLPLTSVYAIDWGKNHKMGIVELKYDPYKNNLYAHELNYKSENELLAELSSEMIQKINEEEGGIIIYTLKRLGIPKDAVIVCDSAVPDNINLLRDYGWEYAYGIDKPKGSVMAGITLLNTTNVFYTSCSEGIAFEQNNYAYAQDRLGVVDDEVVKKNDDLMDPIRYGRRHFENHK